MTSIEKLNRVLEYVKNSFVGKNDIVDLLGISLIAKENAFLLGPPGTAKSYLGTAGTLNDGVWRHVAVTFRRSGNVTTYLEGVEVNS